jgi:uncharacterized protein
MRLQESQRQCIIEQVTRHVGSDCLVSLFGSRVDDSRRGGDVDLLIEVSTNVPKFIQAKLKATLEAHLNLPVDILVIPLDAPLSPFCSIARSQAVPLSEKKVA